MTAVREVPKHKIIKGDKVVVLWGKDKGKQGVILKVIPDAKLTKVVVEGINLVIKAVRANPQKEEKGGNKPIELPMPICKVALIDPSTNKAAKVSRRLIDGRNQRVFRKTGQPVGVSK